MRERREQFATEPVLVSGALISSREHDPSLYEGEEFELDELEEVAADHHGAWEGAFDV